MIFSRVSVVVCGVREEQPCSQVIKGMGGGLCERKFYGGIDPFKLSVFHEVVSAVRGMTRYLSPYSVAFVRVAWVGEIVECLPNIHLPP
jgi:hypothetical protein